MSTDEILIIGTDPPCPRCDYLNQMVADIINDLHLSVPVRHVGYTSDEAHQLAKAEGLVPGTAKEVAKKLGIDQEYLVMAVQAAFYGLPVAWTFALW